MAKTTKTTNVVLFDTIRDLKKLSNKTGVNVFKAVAEKLSSPASQRSKVNLSKLEKVAKEGEILIVPGKVLGNGLISKKLTVVAFKFSESAKERLEKSGSKCFEIRDYIKNKPDSKLRIIG